MPRSERVAVKSLGLDTSNYRTVQQPDEVSAVQATLCAKPDRFWALVESILESGYLPTENILVLESDTSPESLAVKEGNRRIAALKLILGYLPPNIVDTPDEIKNKIESTSEDWKVENSAVPCTIYSATEVAVVNKIIRLAHAKGEKAGRDQWEAVVRARFNRDANGGSEPALDLLEKYLKEGNNLSRVQAQLWAGDYPLTVLGDVMSKIAMRIGLKSGPELAKQYPSIAYRDAVERILFDIGDGTIGFPDVRPGDGQFMERYGIPGPAAAEAAAGTTAQSSSESPTGGSSGCVTGDSGTQSSGPQSTSGSSNPSTASQAGGTAGTQKPKNPAPALDDPKSVKKSLKGLNPSGTASKVAYLREEALRLNLVKVPLAFCFLLRSMFEVSAKDFCSSHKDSGISTIKPDGNDRTLLAILRDITEYLTKGKKDQSMTRNVHGALTELSKSDGILSVTSLNQLVHNTKFTITTADLCRVFNNVFSLLEEMNR